MGRLKKITVQVPEDLLKRAQNHGEGITENGSKRALELQAQRPHLQKAARVARQNQMVDRLQNDEIRPLVAADTSSYRRFLAGEHGADVAAIDATALSNRNCTFRRLWLHGTHERLSAPSYMKRSVMIADVQVLTCTPDSGRRCACCRAMRAKGLKAGLADALIAQSCIDHNVPLVTHDRDFRHFVKAGLKLL